MNSTVQSDGVKTRLKRDRKKKSMLESERRHCFFAEVLVEIAFCGLVCEHVVMITPSSYGAAGEWKLLRWIGKFEKIVFI